MKLQRLVTCALVAVLFSPICMGKGKGKPSEVAVDKEKQVLTTAEHRVITITEPQLGSTHGRVIPKHIVCAEPSPDIAIALAKSLNLGAGLTVKKGTDANAQLASEIAQAWGRT